MSATLKALLQPQILAVLQGSATPGPAAIQPDPLTAQLFLADQLSTAIAVSVQQYLMSGVTVLPGQAVLTAGGPTNQSGVTISPGSLLAT